MPQQLDAMTSLPASNCQRETKLTSPNPAIPSALEIRHDWSTDEADEIYRSPFMDLLFRAQTTHRAAFDPNKVQLCKLLNIKTGGCPEDCGYCSQSAHHDVPLQASKLMDPTLVIEEAKAALAAGATRYCMGAAWRSPKARDVGPLVEVISGVKALGYGLTECAALACLQRNDLRIDGRIGCLIIGFLDDHCCSFVA